MAETLNCVSLLKKNKSKHLEYSRYLDKMQEFYSKKNKQKRLTVTVDVSVTLIIISLLAFYQMNYYNTC